nr:unnamed protein product [Callosobruchus chinensis]
MAHVKELCLYKNSSHNFEHQIGIPFEGSVEELAHILMSKHVIAQHFEEDLIEDLSQFVKQKTVEYNDQKAMNLINRAKDNKTNIEEITKKWEKVLKEEVTEYGEQRCASDNELFATAYHKMVHSPALETMLQLEHMYSQTVRQKAKEKNQLIQEMSER